MSTHPNVILAVALTPDDLSRKTYRAIMEGRDEDLDREQIKIDDVEYWSVIMESDYDESHQIAAKEGDLIFFDLVTYGYGETIDWADLEKKKAALEEWAKMQCEKHHCNYRIFITANYW